MISETTIRPSVPDDALAVERIRIACWQRHYTGIMDAAFLESLDPDESYVGRQAFLASQKGIHLVAVRDGQIVGLSDSGPRRDQEGEASEGEIYSLHVDGTHQGEGIGALLFAAQRKLLFQQGFQRIAVWVLRDNALARGFYEKQGGILGGEKLFITGEKDYPEVLYQWKL